MSRTKKSKPSGPKKTAKPAAAVDVDAKLAESEAKTTKAVAVVEKPTEKAKTAEKLVEKTAALAINPGQVTPYKLDKAQVRITRTNMQEIIADKKRPLKLPAHCSSTSPPKRPPKESPTFWRTPPTPPIPPSPYGSS
jgi:hypothetical protein